MKDVVQSSEWIFVKERVQNDSIYLYIFIKWPGSEFVIIAVYVNDLNIIETRKELLQAVECLKKEFEMKDLGKTKIYLALQIENLSNRILFHQSTYTEKILKYFLHG